MFIIKNKNYHNIYYYLNKFPKLIIFKNLKILMKMILLIYKDFSKIYKNKKFYYHHYI